MSCCGSRRAVVAQSLPARPIARPLPAPLPSPSSVVAFVYTGQTRLVAEGAVTRRRYPFDQPGAVVEVDARDAASFAAIPNLRRRR